MNTLIFYISILVILYTIYKIRKTWKNMGVVTNALLAEDYLALVELSDENRFSLKLREEILNVIRLSGFADMSDNKLLEVFNSHERNYQLNLVAMALERLGCDPRIDNEFWQEVTNPYILSQNKKTIQSFSKRIERKTGRIISIKDTPIIITESSIKDLAPSAISNA